MHRLLRILLLAAASVLITAAPAAAVTPPPDRFAPPPNPIVTFVGHTPVVELSDGGAGLPYLGSTTAYNAGDWEPKLEQFHDSGLYDSEITQIDTIAERWILRAAHRGGGYQHERTRAHTSHHSDHGRGNDKPAIVLDVDETSLSNYSAIQADHFTFGTNSQAEATNEIGKAIAPTLKLFNDAKQAGVAVFFITGRPEAQRAVTEDNLKREGYDGWAGLTLKPAGTTLSTVQYKSGARAAIEQQGYRILANVGDQYSDIAGGHEARGYKLPNPFYFLP
jgi:phosphoglycolate phosphatase-like HAD superfamily hydrolase